MICERATQTRISDLPPVAGDSVTINGRRVRIDRTGQHLGGTRAWFLCPQCDRRCAILYPVACRKCRGLHYYTEHLSLQDRATVKAQHLRRRIGGTGNLSDPIPPKPPWMRWHTYFAARAAIQRADQMHLAAMMACLDRIRGFRGRPL